MSSSAASVAYLILAAFLGGVTLGVVAMVAIAVRKEDQAVLPVRRRARRGGPGGEMAHPFRRRGHALPATRLDVAMNDTVVAIVSAFFVIGILVGIIAVIAMSVLRADRRDRPGRSSGSAGLPALRGPVSRRRASRWDDTEPGRPPALAGG